MAVVSPYKKYKRGQRQANVETTFEKGMMYSEGTVLDGYVKTLVNFDFTQDGKNALKPRAALVTGEVIVPDMDDEFELPADQEAFDEDFLDSDTVLKYSKECVENGVEYRQFIFGKPDVNGGNSTDSGKIWVSTSKRQIDDFEDVVVSEYQTYLEESSSSFYTVGLTEIHNVELVDDAKCAFPVGAFMGNSFYFFDHVGHGPLKKTVFQSDRYVFDTVEERELKASEAVNYGYNMLSSTPYKFDDAVGTSSSFEMDGILPYDSASSDHLMMTPKANTRVWFKCNYAAPAHEYKIVWSWKEVSGTDDWTEFFEDTYDFANLPEDSEHHPILYDLVADLVVPAKEIMVRCEAYNLDSQTPDIVERAMTIGFDFTLDPESTTRNSQPESYDLSSATGMTSWKNRLVVWGVPKDPTILFISDLDEPGYFPYPNNITVFDEPIIAVTELMDSLIVFTKSKAHQVALNEDGTSWTSTVIQSNLYIETWDKHLIQSVRNMVYFKSGNYYYMIVPKAQSTTGELTIAPITTPITDFFNHFKANVSGVFKDCFKQLDEDGNIIQHVPEMLVTYYNFVDYDCIHNFYVYKDVENHVYVHFDIIYSVVDRYWKINIYESAHFLYPFRNDATQTGLMAGTSVHKIVYESVDEDDTKHHIGDIVYKRLVQLFKFNPLYTQDLYIPADLEMAYYGAQQDIEVHGEILVLPDTFSYYISEIEDLVLSNNRVRLHLLKYEWLYLVSDWAWIDGFYKAKLRDAVLEEASAYLADNAVFPNRQFLDTGYRDATPFIYKRYRELQLQINDPENNDMEFGMDFQIAGEPRNTDFLYEVSQAIDEIQQDSGIVYIDATPYLYTGDETIDKVNQWQIKHGIPNDDEHIKVSLWKVRAAVSGKGVAPRMRLYTKSMFNYQLLGINWIYREMNMR